MGSEKRKIKGWKPRLAASLLVFSVSCFMALLLPLPGLAHDEDHCLGHHWSSAMYLDEIRLQMGAIGIGLILCGIVGIVGRLRYAR